MISLSNDILNRSESMEYRILGRTGMKVSAIGIGGEGFENKSYRDCEAIIDCAFKAGINFMDLYNSNPEVRSNVGKALSNRQLLP